MTTTTDPIAANIREAFARRTTGRGTAARFADLMSWPLQRARDVFYGRVPLTADDLDRIAARLGIPASVLLPDHSRDGRREALTDRGERIAALVWNAADDPAFLDQALADMLDAPEATGEHRDLHARTALMPLARRLRDQYPDRPEVTA